MYSLVVTAGESTYHTTYCTLETIPEGVRLLFTSEGAGYALGIDEVQSVSLVKTDDPVVVDAGLNIHLSDKQGESFEIADAANV